MHAPPTSINPRRMLYDRAVDNVLVLRLSRLGRRLLDQLLQDAVDDRGVPFGCAGVDVGGCQLERRITGLLFVSGHDY